MLVVYIWRASGRTFLKKKKREEKKNKKKREKRRKHTHIRGARCSCMTELAAYRRPTEERARGTRGGDEEVLAVGRRREAGCRGRSGGGGGQSG